ncbi:MAG: hypothetical protein NTW21_41595 [Verrucomicrobia bacterium]|nr:hypothetical protein [Verrucomicrobiota bacterium]
MMKPSPNPDESAIQMHLLVAGGSTGAGLDKSRSIPRPQRTLQEVLFRESLSALPQIEGISRVDELRAALAAGLPQNSEITRFRYAESLMKWFFRDGLDGLALTAWKNYRDLLLQASIHRYLYLSTEPIMATCVTGVLPRLQEGIIAPSAYLIGNTEKIIGHELVAKSRKRFLSSLRKLSFLEKTPTGDRVASPPVNKTATLLAMHHAFAVNGPKTIEVAQIEANPFWYFTGIRNSDQLRDFLREADHAGAIGKYVVADRLEQITTSMGLAELLERKVRL